MRLTVNYSISYNLQASPSKRNSLFECLCVCCPSCWPQATRLSIRDISSEASCPHFRGGDDKRTYASQIQTGGHTRLPLFSPALKEEGREGRREAGEEEERGCHGNRHGEPCVRRGLRQNDRIAEQLNEKQFNFLQKKKKDNMAALWKSLCYFVSTEIPAAWYRSNTNRSFPSNAKALMVLVFCCFYLGGRKKKIQSSVSKHVLLHPPRLLQSLCFSEEVFSSFSACSLQPVPTSPTSTSPTPGGTLGMSKMDAPSMQDVYILSPVSGLYGTRSDIDNV